MNAVASAVSVVRAINDLDRDIVRVAAHINAVTYELLCSHHHKTAHEGQFRIDKDYHDAWFFRRPDGRAVPACGFRKDDITDDDADADADVDPGSESAVKEPAAVYDAGNVVKFPTWSETTPRSRRSSSVTVYIAGVT
jgi:hypothetical protein